MARHRYSVSAIILIIFLIIRIFWQGLLGFLVRDASLTNLAINISIGGVVAILYIIALIGVILRRRWGIMLAIISALVDIIYMIFTFFFEANVYGNAIYLDDNVHIP